MKVPPINWLVWGRTRALTVPNTILIRVGSKIFGEDLPFFIAILIDAMNKSVGSGNSHQGHL